MEKSNEKLLTTQKRKELKKKYPDGKAIGKAFIQFYLDQRRSYIEPDFKPALNDEEIDYLKSTIKSSEDRKLFMPFHSLYRLLHSFARWIEHYQHVYYHGLFRGLAVVQTPDYDIQIYHYRKSQIPADEKSIKEAKERYMQSLEPITDILLHNWENLMEFPLKKLYSYSLRLEKMQELLKYDLAPFFPNMAHHMGEVKELQRLARCFRENLDKYINNNNFEVESDVLEALDAFINIDTNSLKPTGKDREEDLKQAIIAVKAVKEVLD